DRRRLARKEDVHSGKNQARAEDARKGEQDDRAADRRPGRQPSGAAMSELSSRTPAQAEAEDEETMRQCLQPGASGRHEHEQEKRHRENQMGRDPREPEFVGPLLRPRGEKSAGEDGERDSVCRKKSENVHLSPRTPGFHPAPSRPGERIVLTSGKTVTGRFPHGNANGPGAEASDDAGDGVSPRAPIHSG